MTISISGKHVELGESLTTHIDAELTSLIHRYMNEPLEAHVVVSKEHHVFQTDVSVHISKHFVVHCCGIDADPYKSTHHALDKLDKQIRKYKERLRDRKRRESDYKELPVSYYIIDSTKEDTGADVPVVIAESAKNIPTVTVSDAVMKLDLMNQPVLLFKNAANNELNVVYKREDGNIGWIDPTKKLS